MNAPHLHLLLNHIPVLGTAFGLGLLVFALCRKSDELKKAALGFLLVTALFSVSTYLTGEPAEEVVEPLPGVLQPHHRTARKSGGYGIVALGMGGLAGLIIFQGSRTVPTWFGAVLLATSLLVGGLMAWTANLGGQIRHTETRSGAHLP